nr:peroxide stress protein YaaA [Microlunatus antarcticus]
MILLPPSEGKAAPARRGRPVDLAALPHPGLTPLREELLDALAVASAQPGAAAALGLSPGLTDEVARNVHLRTTPARRAVDVYTGVLYAALDHASLSPAGRRRANRWVRVQSALWGPVGPTDPITPYRLPMTATLPGVGTVAARWRAVLGPVMVALAGDGVVVDGRSSSYASVWRPTGSAAKAYVAVRVFTEVEGRRVVVSHAAKHTRGLVARWICEAERTPRTPAAVVALVAGHRPCELVPDPRGGWFLDVLAPASAAAAATGTA